MNTWRKLGFNFCVKSQLMRNMGKISAGDLQFMNEIDGLLQIEVGNMFLFTQGIQHYYLASPDFFLFIFVDLVCVGDIGKRTKPKSHHGHFQMPDQDRNDWNIPDHEWVKCYRVQ